MQSALAPSSLSVGTSPHAVSSAISRRCVVCPARVPERLVAAGAAAPSALQPLSAFTTQSPAQARFASTRVYAAAQDYEETSEQAEVRSGDVVEGVVDGLRPYGAFIKINGTDTSGLLHVSQISNEFVDNVDDVLSVGETIKCLVLKVDRYEGRISLSTKRLEKNPGDMLNDRQAVWDGADEMAALAREEWAERRAQRQAEYESEGGERRRDGEGGRGRGRGGGGRGGGGRGRGNFGGGGGRGGGRGGFERRRDEYQ